MAVRPTGTAHPIATQRSSRSRLFSSVGKLSVFPFSKHVCIVRHWSLLTRSTEISSAAHSPSSSPTLSVCFPPSDESVKCQFYPMVLSVEWEDQTPGSDFPLCSPRCRHSGQLSAQVQHDALPLLQHQQRLQLRLQKRLLLLAVHARAHAHVHGAHLRGQHPALH